MDGDDNTGSKSGITGTINLGCPGDSVADLTSHVHQLPCCVMYQGPVPVSQYFKPQHTGIEVDELGVEEAYFRGRKLQGATIPFPQGYCGFVLGKKNAVKEKPPEFCEKNPNDWEMKAKFHNMTIWNHDTLPSQDDPCLRSFHWLAVAEVLHKPVTDEDLASISIVQEKM